MTDNNMTSVRFAPSPTGHLHIGGVRTALFNYFYARNTGGKFILRIEDTDISRSTREMAQEIIAGLRWLGMNWDEGPFYQSDFFPLYRQTAFQLLETGKAYRCFCTPEAIEARRIHSKTGHISEHIFKYDRQCLHLDPSAIAEKLTQNLPFVIRFRVPEGVTSFKDRIHKEMKSDNSELDDFVLLKSDLSPTYHLSVVVDDSRMEVSDVIRGDDHISNTFKQILLFKALDRKPPKYAHLPLILGADKKKLSKRHGETSILEFKEKGYLPEALINYLSQLSWIPADTKQIFSMAELIRQFGLQKLSKNSPVFDYDKLRFLNARAIQQKDANLLYELLADDPQIREKYSAVAMEKKIALIELVKPRMKTLAEFSEKFALYLAEELNYAHKPEELQKLNQTYPNPDIIKYLSLVIPALLPLESFTASTVENAIRECAESHGLKAADFIHPLRFALTFETVSPSIFEVFEFFHKDESLRRINALIHYLEHVESNP